MSANNGHENVDYLGIETVTTVLGGINTELKCLALEPLVIDAALDQKTIHDKVIGDFGSKFLQRKFLPTDLAKILIRMPDGFIDIEGAGEDRTFSLAAPVGHVAAGFAGQMLSLSRDSAVPIRTLVGESVNPKGVDGEKQMRPIEGRLVVLAALFGLARDKWQAGTVLTKEIEKFGLGKTRAYRHLASFRDSKLIEQRDNPRHRKSGRAPSQYKIAPDNGHFAASELIRRYLHNVGRFAVLDPTFIDEGHEELAKIRQNKKLVPYLVKRSFASTNHTGKIVERTQ